ncbi:hypothetical protein [Vreelandella songnenensis]|nr:hypothetical protein [Halomonas songnenensis]
MESIFRFFESLFKNFTWGRFTFLIFALIMSAGSVVIYEVYTNHFKLNRISSELKIIESIVELEKKVESLPEDSPSKRYFARLMAEAESTSVNFSFQPGFPSKKIERISYQSAPWVLLLILIFFTTSRGRGSAIAGVTVIAAPFIVLGYNLPELEKNWIINYLYPWGTLSLILISIVVWQNRKKS